MMLGSTFSSSKFSAGNYVPVRPQDWMSQTCNSLPDAARPLSPIDGVWIYGGPSPSPPGSRPCSTHSLVPLLSTTTFPSLSGLSSPLSCPPTPPPKDRLSISAEPPRLGSPPVFSPLSLDMLEKSRRARRPFDTLSGKTRVDDAEASEGDDDDAATVVGVPSSPIFPDAPQIPSPTSLHRRRMSKLRRHLGDGVPPELVCFTPSRAGTPVGGLDEDVSDDMDVFLCGTRRKLSFGELGGDDRLEEVVKWDAVAQAARIQMEAGRHAQIKRNVTRMHLDKGGRREEKNWSDVLRQLRTL